LTRSPSAEADGHIRRHIVLGADQNLYAAVEYRVGGSPGGWSVLSLTTDRQAKDKQSGQKAKSQQGLFLSGKDIPARRPAPRAGVLGFPAAIEGRRLYRDARWAERQPNSCCRSSAFSRMVHFLAKLIFGPAHFQPCSFSSNVRGLMTRQSTIGSSTRAGAWDRGRPSWCAGCRPRRRSWPT